MSNDVCGRVASNGVCERYERRSRFGEKTPSRLVDLNFTSATRKTLDGHLRRARVAFRYARRAVYSVVVSGYFVYAFYGGRDTPSRPTMTFTEGVSLFLGLGAPKASQRVNGYYVRSTENRFFNFFIIACSKTVKQ